MHINYIFVITREMQNLLWNNNKIEILNNDYSKNLRFSIRLYLCQKINNYFFFESFNTNVDLFIILCEYLRYKYDC